MKLIKFALPVLCLLVSLTGISQTSVEKDARVKWFADARFGMFIHWGLYSAAEGIWKGEPLRYSNNYAEWIRYRNRISKEEYGELAKRFNWNKINPEEWVLLAKKAGMKYIIITAKHHDGVAIWNSTASGYNLSKLSGTNRDVIKELAAACRKHGIKLGFYYSHWLDWEHPYGWDHNKVFTGRVSGAQYNQYWQEKVLPQLKELLTNYGDIAMLWFDMWVDYKATIVTKEQLEEVIKLVRTIQPNCLINSRLGFPASNPGIDFETLGDNQFSTVYKDQVWETPGTIAHSWGYNALENQWKSTSQLLQSLIDNVSLNGGFTLNIGPRADGSVPSEGKQRLGDLGAWLSKNGESIYGGSGLSLRAGQYDWGRITTRKDLKSSDVVYLQVYNWPLDRVLRLTGILSTPQKVTLITSSGKKELQFTQNGPLTHIQLPAAAADPFVSTIVLHFTQPLQLNSEVVAESTFGGFALSSSNYRKNPLGYKRVNYDGLRPSHFVIDKAGELSWEVYIPEAGNYYADISYHNASKNESVVMVDANEQQLKQSLTPTGKVVGEPGESSTDEFVDNRMGLFTFSKAGYYNIRMKTMVSGEKLLFNRIWLTKAMK